MTPNPTRHTAIGRGAAVNLERKVATPPDAQAIRELVDALAFWTVHAPQPDDVVATLRPKEHFRVSFWDAMILRSAAVLECGVL